MCVALVGRVWYVTMGSPGSKHQQINQISFAIRVVPIEEDETPETASQQSVPKGMI